MSFTNAPRRVIFLALPAINLLDLAGPMQVFHVAATHGHYQIECRSPHPTLISGEGMPLGPFRPLECEPVATNDLVIVPGVALQGYADHTHTLDSSVGAWLQTAISHGAHVATVCTGAFVLGEAGLLNGRRCTTHWSVIDALRERYPRATVLDNVLYVHDGSITTSAGIATGIDMALSLVERDYGPVYAAEIARYLVVYIRRNGSHSQQSVYLQYRSHLHAGIHRAQDYMIDHLAEPLTLPMIAAAAGMSVRSLVRAFRSATGITPVAYHQLLRLELAAMLLHNPALTIEAIAQKTGFADVRHFRRLWTRQHGFAPSIYRERLINETMAPNSDPAACDSVASDPWR